MIILVGGSLYQWDTGRKVTITSLGDAEIREVHFANKGDLKARVVNAENENGKITASIPNVLLQSGKPVVVYAVAVTDGEEKTVESKCFCVTARERPDDYVYEEQDYYPLKAILDSVVASEAYQNEIAELAAAKIKTDDSLKTPGMAADSAAVGKRLKPLELVTACQDDSHQAGIHNSHYRGKFLGNAVTEQQWAAIGAGTFEDMYIGDYWDINDVRYRIAAFDYYSGDAVNEHNGQEQLHHITIVPDFLSTTTYQMHAAGGVTKGYVYSDMGKTHLQNALETVVAAFGKGHIMCGHPFLTNFVGSDGAAQQSNYWRYIDLMNEQQVFGGRINGMVIMGELNRVATESPSQFPLFAARPDLIASINRKEITSLYSRGKRYSYWLRDVVSPRGFATVSANAVATVQRSELYATLRPVFSIVASNAKTVAARSTNATYEDYGLEV